MPWRPNTHTYTEKERESQGVKQRAHGHDSLSHFFTTLSSLAHTESLAQPFPHTCWLAPSIRFMAPLRFTFPTPPCQERESESLLHVSLCVPYIAMGSSCISMATLSLYIRASCFPFAVRVCVCVWRGRVIQGAASFEGERE